MAYAFLSVGDVMVTMTVEMEQMRTGAAHKHVSQHICKELTAVIQTIKMAVTSLNYIHRDVMPFIGCATLLLYFVLYYFITEHVCEASVSGYECGPCGV